MQEECVCLPPRCASLSAHNHQTSYTLKRHDIASRGPHVCRERDCYSDEHFLPVLLAAHGLDNETTCRGNTMSVLWSTGAGAPSFLVVHVHGIAMPVQRPT